MKIDLKLAMKINLKLSMKMLILEYYFHDFCALQISFAIS